MTTLRPGIVLATDEETCTVASGAAGAGWWVAGPTVAVAEDADVDVAEVAFFDELGLLDALGD